MLIKNPRVMRAIRRAANSNLMVAELEHVGLSVRTINALEQSKFQCIFFSQLLHLDPEQLRSIANFGDKTLQEIYAALRQLHRLTRIKRRAEVKARIREMLYRKSVGAELVPCLD